MRKEEHCRINAFISFASFPINQEAKRQPKPSIPNDLKLQKAREAKEAAEELQAAKELAVKVEEKPVRLTMKTGEGGKTFGTISTKEVAAAAKEQLGLDIDKKKMKLDEPIKTLGNHIITVKLHKDVTAKLTVSVGESK